MPPTPSVRRLAEDFELRPIVADFARSMEIILRRNDWKGGWDEMTPSRLFRRLRAETNELERVLKRKTVSITDGMQEAVDVANFAMMIYDKLNKRIPVILQSLSRKGKKGSGK